MSTLPAPAAPAARPRSGWRAVFLLLAVTASVAALTFGYVFLLEPQLQRRQRGPAPVYDGPMGPQAMSTPLLMPGIRLPPSVPAGAAGLDDAEAVIGVSAGGKERAYLVSAFGRVPNQVVNDLLGDVPVTVTHDARAGHTVVYTSDQRGAPLDLGVAGQDGGRLVLYAGRFFFFQESGQGLNPAAFDDFAYPTLPFERMSWRAWREAHGETDAYVGLPELSLPPGRDPRRP